MALRVDALRPPVYPCRQPAGSGLVALLGCALLTGCASAGGARLATPPRPDLAVSAIEATAPRGAIQATFSWQLQERTAHFDGRGVARIEEPYRVRIDLFGPRGDTYLRAVAVGDDLRLPPNVKADELPPVPLLWSALGVLRPPRDAVLTATRVDSAGETLEYDDASGNWHFELEHGRLVRAVWQPHGGGRHSVSLKPGRPVPSRADYRDWLAYRELILNLEDVKHVSAFPAEIWTLGF